MESGDATKIRNFVRCFKWSYLQFSGWIDSCSGIDKSRGNNKKNVFCYHQMITFYYE